MPSGGLIPLARSRKPAELTPWRLHKRHTADRGLSRPGIWPVKEILDQWYAPDYWTSITKNVGQLDELIVEFNRRVGLLEK